MIDRNDILNKMLQLADEITPELKSEKDSEGKLMSDFLNSWTRIYQANHPSIIKRSGNSIDKAALTKELKVLLENIKKQIPGSKATQKIEDFINDHPEAFGQSPENKTPGPSF